MKGVSVSLFGQHRVKEGSEKKEMVKLVIRKASIEVPLLVFISAGSRGAG